MEYLKNTKIKVLLSSIFFITVFILLAGYIYSQIGSGSAETNPKSKSTDIINAFKQSYNYEAVGKLNKAIDVLMEFYDLNNYEINLRLGWLYYQSKQYTESMGYYMNAINAMPYSIEARFGYVLPASALEEWVKVIEQYNFILSVDPQNTRANYRMGLINYYKPDYNTAQKYFEKVVNLYPFDYDGVLMLAWTYYRLGKTNEAKILFEKCLMIKPEDKSALEGLSLIR